MLDILAMDKTLHATNLLVRGPILGENRNCRAISLKLHVNQF
jgi:hypothetical protein